MLTSFLNFLNLILEKRSLIISMARREITTQYVGSLLGFVWTFIHPMVMVCVFWFVFSVGFKSKPMGDVPFVVWLTAGMAPWFMFADVVLGSVGMIVANGHLIKKTLFPSQILPVIKLISGSVTHAIFLTVLLVLILFQQMPISFFYLQVFYYYICLIVLILGVSWAVSALNVFIRDIGQVVGVVVQVGFWATPIFWDINMMPPKVQFFLKLNPMYYIVQGYRDTFISFKPFWLNLDLTLYFWVCTIAIFLAGASIFRKLKVQFADTL
ncbi:ABC transporter permease [Desulfopila inferna]|uniref:ABC transporter permease n=1 Tax=Desulfopila inferna TaxID=468528 RepID=UPI001964ACC8|nr:ABC transporter permease [Desulfopila inferna]MBM9602722.1 ABC transporter permease [Desulfopila inferna]